MGVFIVTRQRIVLFISKSEAGKRKQQPCFSLCTPYRYRSFRYVIGNDDDDGLSIELFITIRLPNYLLHFRLSITEFRCPSRDTFLTSNCVASVNWHV